MRVVKTLAKQLELAAANRLYRISNGRYVVVTATEVAQLHDVTFYGKTK